MEQIVNQLTSFVNQAAGIGPGDTTFQLLDTSLFPVPGASYRISVDSEIMLVTGNVAGLLTVTRAQEGTIASGHVNGSIVVTVVTAGAMYGVFSPVTIPPPVAPNAAFAQMLTPSVLGAGGSLQVSPFGGFLANGSASLGSEFSADSGIVMGADGFYAVSLCALVAPSVPGDVSVGITVDGASVLNFPMVGDTSFGYSVFTGVFELTSANEVGAVVASVVGGENLLNVTLSIWQVG